MAIIIIGAVLILLQFLSYIGNLATGGVEFFATFSIYEIIYFLSYNLVGIIGLVFLVLGIRSIIKVKQSIKVDVEPGVQIEEQITNNHSKSIEAAPTEVQIAQPIKQNQHKPDVKEILKNAKEFLKKTACFLSTHLKITIISTLVCATLFILSWIGCSVSEKMIDNAWEHYEETIVYYDKKDVKKDVIIGCGLKSCIYCDGKEEDFLPTFDEWITGEAEISEGRCEEFDYYNSAHDWNDFFETSFNIFLILLIVCFIPLIIGIAYRYKFIIQIKRRR